MIVNKTYKVVLFLVCGLCFGICHAQYSFKGTITPLVTVQTVLSLELTHNVSGTMDFNSTPQYSDGISIPNFITVKIKSNKTWAFGVATTTANFNASGLYSSPNMPSQVLSMRQSSQTQDHSLSTTTKIIATGGAGNAAKSGNTFDVNMKANPKYDYGPGIYTITINYTLTAQ
jgi:hypothetical protein